MENNKDKHSRSYNQFDMAIRTSSAELSQVSFESSSASFWYIPAIALAFFLIFDGLYGLLWMMGGVGLRWKDYGIITVGIVGRFGAAVWLIQFSVSVANEGDETRISRRTEGWREL